VKARNTGQGTVRGGKRKERGCCSKFLASALDQKVDRVDKF